MNIVLEMIVNSIESRHNIWWFLSDKKRIMSIGPKLQQFNLSYTTFNILIRFEQISVIPTLDLINMEHKELENHICYQTTEP